MSQRRSVTDRAWVLSRGQTISCSNLVFRCDALPRWRESMFSKRTAIGAIQPYFLSQIEHSLSKSEPIDSGANQALVQAQASKTAEVLADFISHAAHRLDIAIYDFRLGKGPIHDTVVDAINKAAR